MHRQPLRTLLAGYAADYPEEASTVEHFRAFVEAHDDCLVRTCRPGHITASAWILSPDRTSCLLTLHRKLGRWLQLGGHVDGEPEVGRAALREAREESGMARFRMAARPLDLDIHPIPAHGGEAAHLHLDVRFLMGVAPGQSLTRSAESLDLRWFPVGDLASVTTEASVLRLQAKTRDLFSRVGSTDDPLGTW